MTKKSKWGFSTKSIHIGNEADKEMGSVSPPIHLTSTFKQDGVGKNRGHDYSRVSNPTRQRLEENLASLDGAKYAVCYSTGMAATTALFQLFNAGDHILISRNTYGGTFRMSMNVLKRQGLEFDWIDTRDPEIVKKHIKSNTRLVHVETPTNPLLELCDIQETAKLCKTHEINLAVDNTFMSPYGQTPLDLGADIVMHSATKYIAGHSDVVIGAIVVNDEQLYNKLSFIQNASGATPGPMDCFLTLRGIKTLHLRMQRHSENAEKVPIFLRNHDKIGNVYWAGFSDNKNYKIAEKQMHVFGGMVSFIPKDNSFESAKKIAENLKLFTLAESLGGVESLCCHPASMTHASIPPEERKKSGLVESLLRLSVGIEDVEDLIEDLNNAIG